MSVPEIIFAAMTIATIWVFICNHRTYRQRLSLIDFRQMLPHETYRELRQEWDDVSYERHFMALVLFRDPSTLYPITRQIALNSLLTRFNESA